jgi:hypothetical protein
LDAERAENQLGDGADDLSEEEGVAVGAIEDRVDGRLGQRRAERAPDHGTPGGLRELGELELPDVRALEEGREPGLVSVAAGDDAVSAVWGRDPSICPVWRLDLRF